jgi:hypothetical protein
MPDTPENPPPIRIYTCYIDDELYSKAFRLSQKLRLAELSTLVNRQFNEWLEATAPGARAAGKVTEIRFSDHME